MYDDSWYSFAPDSSKKGNLDNYLKHARPDSLPKQSNAVFHKPDQPDTKVRRIDLPKQLNYPPKATLTRRAKSYSNFHDVATVYPKRKEKTRRSSSIVETDHPENGFKSPFEELEEEFLDHSHRQYMLYRDQLELTERHLENILEDTSSALDLLATLSESFKSVELETTAFQGQCEDLLADKKRLLSLANQVGTHLQYYAYLEPLTRRLNLPGVNRLVRSDDFLDILLDLNACIDFMDQHPGYKDSSVFKTRYLSLLEKALNLIQTTISSNFKDVTDEVVRELRSKDHNETSEYILLYGKYESIQAKLGPSIKKLLKSRIFAFGAEGLGKNISPYVSRYHELWSQIVDIYIKNREAVMGVVSKNLKSFMTVEKPKSDFQTFARHAVQYVLDICHSEKALLIGFFYNGPLLVEYGTLPGWNKSSNFAERLEENCLSHLKTLHSFLYPYMSNGDLQLICDLVNWLENMYLASPDGELDIEPTRGDRAAIGQAYLEKYLWKSLDEVFLSTAKEIEHFKPSPNDLQFSTTLNTSMRKSSGPTGEGDFFNVHNKFLVSNAYPTVKTAVRLLVLYNDGFSDRPRINDVFYEIVHQTTNSLQKAATIIMRSSGIMDAQLFLIKNLMLIENLFMTHEIPDSVRQSAEFDFTPIWNTISDLQAQKQLFNPLAYITPLVRGRLLPAVVDRILDARKELERVLVQQITAFTKKWQQQLADEDPLKREAATAQLELLLNKVFDDGTTRAALWKMIKMQH